MVTYCRCKNMPSFTHMMCRKCECLILDCCTIFDNDYKAVSHGISVEFQWDPMASAGNYPRGSQIPTISIRFPWKKVGISMEMETQMAEAPAKCFP